MGTAKPAATVITVTVRNTSLEIQALRDRLKDFGHWSCEHGALADMLEQRLKIMNDMQWGLARVPALEAEIAKLKERKG